MILNYTSTTSVQDELHRLPDTFYLTGSRYFGVNESWSDYDYFVQYSEGLVNNLKDLGFRSVSVHDYGDSLCVAVMRKYCYVLCAQVDVQLVTNPYLKQDVQKRFKELDITKPTQAEWNLAFKMFETPKLDISNYVESLANEEVSTLLTYAIERIRKMGRVYTDKWPITEAEYALVKEKQFINAIKSYRERYSCGLLEAKRAIDSIRY